MTTSSSHLSAAQVAPTATLNTPWAEADLRAALGVDIDHSGAFLTNLLADQPRQEVRPDSQPATAKRKKSLPRTAEAWVKALFEETTFDHNELLANPPERLHEVEDVLSRREHVGYDRDVWAGLDRMVPGWVAEGHIDHALETNNTKFLAHLGASGNKSMESITGLSFDPHRGRSGGRWVISTSRHIRRSLPYPPEPEWNGEDGVLLEKIWQPSTNRDGLIQITSWAEQLTDYLGGCRDEALLWLYQNVDELQAYTHGNDRPWHTAAERSPSPLRSEPAAITQMGTHYVVEAARVIRQNEHLAQSNPGRFLELARNWLGVPLMADRKVFERLGPQGRTIETPPGLIGQGEPIVMRLLLADPITRPGYINILRHVASQPLEDDVIRSLQNHLGCTASDVPERITSQDTSGLVEAAMLAGQGTVLNRLLADPDGVAAIRQVLDGENGTVGLIHMGYGLGWGRMAQAVTEQPEAWRSWRDHHQNNITHWLLFGQNKLDNQPVWHTIPKLLTHFPEHFQEANAQGKDPTDFLSREQADRVAAKLIRKAGKLAPEDRKPRTKKPVRRI